MDKEWYSSLKFDKLCTDYVNEGYDAMLNIKQAAEKIREILLQAGDDEASPEHCIEAAKIVLGSTSNWTDEDYARMLSGLAFVFQKFIIQPMN